MNQFIEVILFKWIVKKSVTKNQFRHKLVTLLLYLRQQKITKNSLTQNRLDNKSKIKNGENPILIFLQVAALPTGVQATQALTMDLPKKLATAVGNAIVRNFMTQIIPLSIHSILTILNLDHA
jgi:hypothetical protein